MKYLLTILCLCVGLSLSAQSYYVAIVKGKVYYEDVLLKPRTKIELKGNFRFSTKDDYVKVSGPNGIHTIRPEEKEGGGYEFLRAVTQELFPAAKPRGSFVLSTWILPGDCLGIYCENEFSPDYFVAGERVSLGKTLKKWQHKHLYWVYQTPDGKLVRNPAKVVDGKVEFTEETFLAAGKESAITGQAVYLFYFRDKALFRGFADKFSLDKLFWATNPDAQPGRSDAKYIAMEMGEDPTQSLKSEDGQTTYQPYPEIKGLGWIAPEELLGREAFMEEMLLYFLASDMDSVSDFLLGSREDEREDYSGILMEQYGAMNFHRVEDAFIDYLYEHRNDSPRMKTLWKLNKE